MASDVGDADGIGMGMRYGGGLLLAAGHRYCVAVRSDVAGGRRRIAVSDCVSAWRRERAALQMRYKLALEGPADGSSLPDDIGVASVAAVLVGDASSNLLASVGTLCHIDLETLRAKGTHVSLRGVTPCNMRCLLRESTLTLRVASVCQARESRSLPAPRARGMDVPWRSRSQTS